MRKVVLKVKENTALNACTYKMVLVGDCGKMRAGQFVEVALEGHYLRRPFSIADIDGNELTLLYKIVGGGTLDLSKAVRGDSFDVLTELGNSFDTARSNMPLLVGGGIGIAPLYALAKAFAAAGKEMTIVLGFRNKEEAFFIEEFKALGKVIVATDDGSLGVKGNVLTAINKGVEFDFYYACGPMVMLKAVANFSKRGQVSLEAHMGCGFGACMGCSVPTLHGSKRICKEGPIFDAGEVIF